MILLCFNSDCYVLRMVTLFQIWKQGVSCIFMTLHVFYYCFVFYELRKKVETRCGAFKKHNLHA